MTMFSKILSNTDVGVRLSFPTKYLKCLPSFKGGTDHSVNFEATDEKGEVWTFKCCIRKTGRHPKPVISTGWLAFVAYKKLKAGDMIKFYFHKEEIKNNKDNLTHVCKVRAEKEIKIFGRVFGYAPLPCSL